MPLEGSMKTLYFDIDGTILLNDQDAVKPELGDGGFESAVRRAGFDHLVCVGNFCAIAHAMRRALPDYDAIGVLFIEEPHHRASRIDLSIDWWYADDLAEHYMTAANQAAVFREHNGGRICVPDPVGSGQDLLEWLKQIDTDVH